MATRRDWANGAIELPLTGDIALQGHVTGGTDPAWKITAGGALTVASVTTAGAITVASLGVTNSAAATTVGTVTKKIQVFDAAGVSLGYLPVYDAIT